MNKLRREQIIRLIVVTAALFFTCSIINHIIFYVGTGLGFYVNLIFIIVLLSIVMLLFEKLWKIDDQRIKDIKNEFETKISDLTHRNSEIESKLTLLEKKENERIGNQTKEAELKKIVSDFLENNSKSPELMNYLTDTFKAMAAILYIQTKKEGNFTVKETFGLPEEFVPASFSEGEGLNGQVVSTGKPQLIKEVPEDYFKVLSGLGQTKPRFLYLLPILESGRCVALVELASFEKQDLEIVWDNITVKNENKQQ